MTERTCDQCHAVIANPHDRRKPQRFCTELCRSRWREKNRPPRSPRVQIKTSRCGWCDTEVTTTSSAPRKYCSTLCAGHGSALVTTTPIPWHPCEWCGHWFINRLGRRKYCSEACLRITEQRRSKASPIEYGACIECAGVFVRRAGRLGKYCSLKCSRRARKRNRRHRKRAGATPGGPVITTALLAERDGPNCHVCRRRLKWGGDPESPTYPSIDHLVPLSEGGAHTLANTAVACRRCNWERNQHDATQLRLVG